MRNLDLPPVWLAVFLALLWAQARIVPLPLFGALGEVAGWALVAAGVLLMLLSLREFARAKTSVVPHRQPTAIVTRGVYAMSRNPIYLADALVLAGAGLIFDTVLVVVAVPFFIALITRRFVAAEEARLGATFPEAFEAWRQRTRRWL